MFGYLHFWGFLWPWKLTLNIELTLIIQFCFQDDLFKLCFLTRCLSIFTAIDEKKEEQKSTYQIFLKDVTEEKNLEIHKHSGLSMVWIFKKLNSFKSNYLINYLLSKTYKRITLSNSNYRCPKQIFVSS